MESLELTLHGRAVRSVFDLLGRNENDLTAAFGFALQKSPRLLALVSADLMPGVDSNTVGLRMETADAAGRTDLELYAHEQLVVVEAKAAWLLPTAEQLRAYAPRVAQVGGGQLVTLSNASLVWAKHRVPTEIDGIPTRHLPWSQVLAHVEAARAQARGTERVWLDEFATYTKGVITMTDPADCWTYCVVITNGRPAGGGELTLKEYVTVANSYFHPFGKNWPKTPSNFLAFRWDNYVQQVRRVLSHEVVENLQQVWPDIPSDEGSSIPHIVHRLGPNLLPKPLPSGVNYQAGRMLVLLDTLFSSASLKDAIAASNDLSS